MNHREKNYRDEGLWFQCGSHDRLLAWGYQTYDFVSPADFVNHMLTCPGADITWFTLFIYCTAVSRSSLKPSIKKSDTLVSWCAATWPHTLLVIRRKCTHTAYFWNFTVFFFYKKDWLRPCPVLCYCLRFLPVISHKSQSAQSVFPVLFFSVFILLSFIERH